VTKAIGVNTKKRGRPVTTGKGQLVGVRLQPEQIEGLDAWIATFDNPKLTRPMAIRLMIQMALQDRRKLPRVEP
jgi:hypothetical protein